MPCIATTPRAQSSQKHATVARCTSKRRSFGLRSRSSLPASAELGAGRPIGTWNIDSNASGINVQNDTNLRDRIKSQRCIRFPNQGGNIRALGGRRAKPGERQDSKYTGKMTAPSRGASSNSVAIVRPWFSSESESSEPGKNVLTHYSNTSCRSITTARPHTHGR